MRTHLLLAVAFGLGCAMAAAGDGVPIEYSATPCPAYGPPNGPVGLTDRFCGSFHAVAGEQVGAGCTASGSGFGGSYPMQCTVLIGPANGDSFAVRGAQLSYRIPETGDYLVEAVYFGRQTFFANETFHLDELAVPRCIPDANSLCLAGARFRVTADWQAPDGRSGHATAVGLTDESGSFSFFDASNIEIVVKVHDACAFNGKWWVFAGGLTNVGVTLTVTDTNPGGGSKTYVNPEGTACPPLQDTEALPCP